ncbi:tetratricopeptide repeat protein [Mariniphaga sp.]|uniref:tetratricopeptide repeat protein n=1 Tax=Mariniphaga sp. TaxID=1954475 RepID=UPI003561CF50
METKRKNSTSVTLAVFPFENLTEGNRLGIFCRSLWLDLITELSKFRQFTIIAEQSVKIVNANHIDSDYFKLLNTDYYITGAVTSYEKRLIINAQLFNSSASHIIWANRFEGNSEDLFALQENLLMEIVSSLQKQLDYDLVFNIKAKPKSSLKAYENWLLGMEEIKNGTPESDLKARKYFQEALQIDPNYSLACSGMSLTYFNEWSCQLMERWDVCKGGAHEWAQKAIDLDGQNHVAAFVLGRTLLYNGEYDRSEHYLRKALRLSPNDVDSLVQIAQCFAYLNYAKEAEKIYRKIIKLNPLLDSDYNQIGSFIYFELRNFEKCIELGSQVDRATWIDFDAYMAAAFYHSGDLEKMQINWQTYLNKFKRRTNENLQDLEKKALNWMMEINPYKDRSPMHDFWEFIGGKNSGIETKKMSSVQTKKTTGIFLKEAEFWQMEYEGKSVFLPEVKGFFDISELLANPEKEVHCAELMGSVLNESSENLIDETAKKQYQHRILEIQQELDEAETNNDTAVSLRLQEEYDNLLNYLSSSMGLGNKSRKASDSVEKARSAVTWRIRNAIRKIEKAHPELAKHLTISVKTGTFCSYKPEKPVTWIT